MFCPNCGKEIPANASYCSFCGQRVQTLTQSPQAAPFPTSGTPAQASHEVFCSKCGAPNSDDASFCGKCGNPIRNLPSATAAQQPQPSCVAPPAVQQGNRKDPILAGFLNLFIGLGYLYLGYKTVLGLPTVLFVLVVLVIDVLVGIFTLGLIPLVLAILLAYDGYVKARGYRGYINAEPALLYQ